MCVPPSPHFGRSLSNPAAQLLTLEIFNHRFYKALDDTVCCDEMGENDTIVCFELPCHAQQSRTYKAEPDDPFILAVLPSETTPVRPNYNGRGSTVFGYPFVTVISQEQARHSEAKTWSGGRIVSLSARTASSRDSRCPCTGAAAAVAGMTTR